MPGGPQERGKVGIADRDQPVASAAHASTLDRAGFTVLGLTGCMRAENVF